MTPGNQMTPEMTPGNQMTPEMTPGNQMTPEMTPGNQMTPGSQNSKSSSNTVSSTIDNKSISPVITDFSSPEPKKATIKNFVQ